MAAMLFDPITDLVMVDGRICAAFGCFTIGWH
jgi:hypothetical protein